MARTLAHYPRGSKILETDLELSLYFRSLGHSLQARYCAKIKSWTGYKPILLKLQ